MFGRRHIIWVFLLIFFFWGFSSKSPTYSIRLRWYKSVEGENWNYASTGFLWNLSYLGAGLPKGCTEKLMIRDADSVTFTLDLREAGFSKEAMNSWSVLLDSLKSSEEYRSNGCMDMGRFILLTESSSWHYYEITGAARTFTEFKARHELSSAHRFLVVSSGVSTGERLIQFTDFDDLKSMAFVAEVGEGSVRSGTFHPSDIEVFDVMENGQLRFAVYGHDGRLKASSNSKHSLAGKPAKCIWCHESSVQPLYYGEEDVDGFMSASTFLCYVDSAMQVIKRYRSQLSSEIDYSNTHHHTWSEINYLGFVHPSLLRIAQELNVSEDEVLQRAGHLPTHTVQNFPFYYRQYPFFGDFHGALSRSDVDKLKKFVSLQVPEDPIEPGIYEPNFFNPGK